MQLNASHLHEGEKIAAARLEPGVELEKRMTPSSANLRERKDASGRETV